MLFTSDPWFIYVTTSLGTSLEGSKLGRATDVEGILLICKSLCIRKKYYTCSKHAVKRTACTSKSSISKKIKSKLACSIKFQL